MLDTGPRRGGPIRRTLDVLRAQSLGAAALFLVLAGGSAFAAIVPVGPDGDIDACYDTRNGALSIRAGAKCPAGKKPVAWNQKGPRGPRGLPGSPAASLLTGFVRESMMPYGSRSSFVPVGEADDADEFSLNGNSTVVLRDLRVEIATPPGVGTGWAIEVGANSLSHEVISCEIKGAFATSCSSGSQTATIQPGEEIGIWITNNLPVAEGTPLLYGYRAVTP